MLMGLLCIIASLTNSYLATLYLISFIIFDVFLDLNKGLLLASVISLRIQSRTGSPSALPNASRYS